jgi:hypothetical protein
LNALIKFDVRIFMETVSFIVSGKTIVMKKTFLLAFALVIGAVAFGQENKQATSPPPPPVAKTEALKKDLKNPPAPPAPPVQPPPPPPPPKAIRESVYL